MNTRDTTNPWKGCARIRMGGNFATPVEPRAYAAYTSTATFSLRVKADGWYNDGQFGTEDFNLVSAVWMTPSAGSTPSIRIQTATYDGLSIVPPTGGAVAAGLAGTDVAVQLPFQVTGTAPWYQNEVAYLGTSGPNGTNHNHQSQFVASTWPKDAACSSCRSARVDATTQPTTGAYTFKFTVHIPLEMQRGVYHEYFQPVADVGINTGGIASSYFGSVVPITIVVVGTPVGSHELTAVGDIGGDPASGYNTTTATSPAPQGLWFACGAAATADAVSTTVDACVVTITRADGSMTSVQAPSESSDGGIATTEGLVTDNAAGGDTAQVCWEASASYLDGSTQSTSGCSG